MGNNISALCQGVEYYRKLALAGVPEPDFPGIRVPRIGDIGVCDVEIVAGFDVHRDKVGAKLAEALMAPPNNYPQLDVDMPTTDVIVDDGLREDDDPAGPAFRHLVSRLEDSRAEVLLYSLPTGLQWAATAYARAALKAGVAFVNCTPEIVGRDEALLAEYERAGVPLIGDDLASHLGSSVVHRSLLALLAERGLTLCSSYQLNFGGNEDFRNLREVGESKRTSKLNALSQAGVDTSKVEVIPSAGFVGHLADNKVAILNIEGQGWAGTSVSLDVKLKVQDSSNAAGVIIDLIRVACAARRAGMSGFTPAAVSSLKSPSGGHGSWTAADVHGSWSRLDGGTTVP
ncbi:hypothetical protein [Pseudonocardia sp. TMWB2A]|uniref:hypothetical protein n=1 Tax=Pseudonocardia sp. TMWB2A TaxID=687430 RepID=UPI00307F17D4